MDARSETNNSYLYEPNYFLGKIGVSFRYNTFELGGRIDVIPKTHKMFRHLGGLKIPRYLYQKSRLSLPLANKERLKIIVPLKA
jgi:hypothetical protein